MGEIEAFCERNAVGKTSNSQLTPMCYKHIADLMRVDHDYAWSWHCNIAMPMLDALPDAITHKQANRAAARVMQHLFGIDVTTFNEYKSIVHG